MRSSSLPFVTILTPVYNGEKYLVECIESVLAQTFENWEYIIINNCSTDGSLAIAEHYARKDPRIRVLTNARFVGVIESHNIAFGLVPLESKYCKVVSADDWITPDCVTKMVSLAEAYPTAAIIGSYQRRGEEVRWKGLPRNIEFISGREVCRLTLLGNIDVFGGPTNVLYRSGIIMRNQPFFPHLLPHADTSACYKYLQGYDFGFVHEILSVERVHDQQLSSTMNSLAASSPATLEILLTYGPIYLSEAEFEGGKRRLLQEYYRCIGCSVLQMREREFWKYHTSRLRDLGYPMQWRKVIRATVDEILEEAQKPSVAFKKLAAVIRVKCQNRHANNS